MANRTGVVSMTRTACLNSIYELAKKDECVVFIGSDLAPNTMADFKRDFPDRWFMEGISEQHVIGLAAGLALEGFIPYVNNIATFITRRCYEQIVLDICSHNLPVRLLGNGGGLVYAPLGQTHIGFDDLALMRGMPGMTVVCPSDNAEMKDLMQMSLSYDGPMYFRLAKDTDPAYITEVWNDDAPVLVVSTGIMSGKARLMCNALPFDYNILHMPIIKPFQHVTFLERLGSHKAVITMEEGIINGGLGSAVIECLADNNIQIPVLRFGIPDAFAPHYGEQDDLLETYGLTPEKMAARIKGFYDQATRPVRE